jgi:hypothetical protein
MPDRSPCLEVTLRLDAGPDSDHEELDRLTGQLWRRLAELDVDEVRRPTIGPAPDGARGPDAATIGMLVVQLTPMLPTLRDVVQTVRAWLSHAPQRSAILEIDGDRIEVTGISLDDQRDLIRLWTDRHARG